ncbi:MAG TPA: cell division protein ZapD [Gammaproteobacteria bacterium]
MVDPAEQLQSSSPEDGHIKFEQPLTERMRTFLRIEFLFEQASFHSQDPTQFGTRAAIASLLEILVILGRGDIRAEVMKELERHAELLNRFRRKPGVDVRRLDGLIADLAALRAQLAEAGPQFMNPLKECDFLTSIRHRSAIPGGTCVFDLPDYAYWLHLPYNERARQFEDWTTKLRRVCDPVSKVLWLTRETIQPAPQVAAGGLYQCSLPRNEQFNLVRVLLPANGGVFPEISAGQHRFTIRFVEWQGVEKRATQAHRDVRFLLALC